MATITERIDEILEQAFIKAGHGAGFGHAIVSNRPDLCEYQCNSCMALAKKEHKKPIDIANAVAGELKDSEAFSMVTACMPGFINMDLRPSFLASVLSGMAGDGSCGLEKDEKRKKIIVDYGGANVAKPLHVGHLRSAVIGESLKRIGAAMGNDMTGDVHLGDWGLQMGLIIEELKDRGQKEFTLSDLEEIYPAASKRSKETGEDGAPTAAALEFKERALKSTHSLQCGDPECMEVWRRIMELSIPDLKANYGALDVSFELWKGESDVQKYIPGMVESFVEKGVAYESQGALVVDIAEPGDPKELPPCIVRKSDGSALYATTDLATIYERELLYKPDAYIYVADLRQSLHYESFFRVARKAGLVREDQSLRFLGFGTMNGKDGKPFKTRSGGVMRLEILINEINDAVYEKIRASRSEEEIPEEEAAGIAAKVGLAALKYGDLSNQAAKDYIFDIDRFTNFDGNTGPYILYTIVRIRSILKRYMAKSDAEWAKEEESLLLSFGASASCMAAAMERTPVLKALSLILARYPESVAAAWENLAPHRICQFIYDLSNAFSAFYRDVRILQEEDAELKKAYLSVLALTLRVLLNSIDMLGFSAPDRM